MDNGRSGRKVGALRKMRRSAGRVPLAIAVLAAILLSFTVLAGASDSLAEGPQASSPEMSENSGPADWGMPPDVFPGPGGNLPTSAQSPVDGDRPSDLDDVPLDFDLPAVPSISPESAPSLEVVLAPLRAVPPAVYEACAAGSRSTPTATPRPFVPTATATPWAQPTAVPTRAGADAGGSK